ncbi:response regulator [Schlesneria paludicola]|uniref:response regulator n=1 Tax=Schlesneria paludicola TaxID=360056 RepID=UPI00192C5DC2|nr:response regulator [Schlesneria paludicola]
MKRLMIVDDALIMRMKIREIATKAGWTVVAEAPNGAEAVRLFDEHHPDMVTLDMVMPEMDGLSALKAIRSSHPAANVVMVSAVNQKEKLRECITAGAVDFIVKPFDPEQLQAFFERFHRDM